MQSSDSIDSLTHLTNAKRFEQTPSASPAEVASIQALLNCYCRELGQNRVRFFPLDTHKEMKILVIDLPHTKTKIIASIDGFVSKINQFTYSGTCFAQTEIQPWMQLTSLSLAELIARELAMQYQSPEESDFLENIRDSIRTLKLILKHRPPNTAEKLEISRFLQSEQSLIYGHPFHPSPKSRINFSEKDLLCFSPELGGSFPLHFFAVRKEFIKQEFLGSEETASLIKNDLKLSTPSECALIPTHPWEASFLLKIPEFQSALREGKLVDLGAQGPRFFATSSVRTLFRPESTISYKTSIHVRITNCMRLNLPKELKSSIAITEILRRLQPDLMTKYPCLTILEEPAYISVDFGILDRSKNSVITHGLSTLLRTGQYSSASRPGYRSFKEEESILVASLFGNAQQGQRTLNHLIPKSYSYERWWTEYLSLLLPPLLDLFFNKGLLFEAHLQNVVVRFTDGIPTHFFLRDLENVRILENSPAHDLIRNTNPALESSLVYEEEKALNRFLYTLFVNHLCEAIYQLSNNSQKLETSLWNILKEYLVDQADSSRNSKIRQPLEAILKSPFLPAKSNLLTRFQRIPDHKANFIQIPNPMYDHKSFQ